MKKTLLTILIIILTVSIGAQITNAIGTLTPSGTPGDDTQYSLNDIYDKLANFADTPTATSSPFTTPGSVSASFRTLTEIYDLLTAENSDLVASNIATGTSVFGVLGTMEAASPELDWSTYQGSLNWNNAVSTCAALTEGGATAGDWRLPNAEELSSKVSSDFIVEGDGSSNDLSLGNYYWSSSAAHYDSSQIWYFSWQGYYINSEVSTKDNTYTTICVR